MDALVIVLIVAAVALVFYLGLRAYTRRRISAGKPPSDID
jgi:hypothetical protein